MMERLSVESIVPAMFASLTHGMYGEHDLKNISLGQLVGSSFAFTSEKASCVLA